MQEFGFIQAIGKKPMEFWQESDDIAAGQDASNILSYMKLMFDEAKKAGIKLRKADFKKFGKKVELFDGVLEWFSLINSYGKERGVKVEHYINSSGLAEMIEGTPIAKEFKRIFRMLIPLQQEWRSRMAWRGGRLHRKDTVPLQNQQGNTQHQGQQAREREPA